MQSQSQSHVPKVQPAVNTNAPKAQPQQLQTINMQQQVFIEALPPVLVLHTMDVCPEDVFGGGVERDGMRCAYLLFYRRV